MPLQCQECGEMADGTVDIVPGRALFTPPDKDGHVEWAGDTTMFWEGQRTEMGPNGEYMLECVNAHQWLAVLVDDEVLHE